MSRRVRLLYLHVNEDAALLQALTRHLTPLKQAGLVDDWHEGQLLGGQEIQAEINRQLRRADIVLVLLSADLVASPRWNELLPQVLAAKAQRGVIIVPVVVRPVHWRPSTLGGLSALPVDGKAVTLNSDQDAAWVQIVEGIEQLIAKSKSPDSTYSGHSGHSIRTASRHQRRTKILPVFVAMILGLGLGILAQRYAEVRNFESMNTIATFCHLNWEFYCSKELSMYEEQCRSGSMASCIRVAAMYETGKGAERDTYKASYIYKNACDNRHSDGCVHLALLYENGTGVPRDQDIARSLFQRACDLGSEAGCTSAAVIYTNSGDYIHSSRLFRRACKTGYISACSNLGKLYKYGQAFDDNGQPEPKNIDEAHRLFSLACNGGISRGCINLGRLYETGFDDKVKQDLSRSLDLYGRACKLNSNFGCTSLGYMYDIGLGVAPDKSRARELYESSCIAGDPRACNNLGDIYEHGEGVPKDGTRAFVLYKRACDERYSVGCRSLAKMYLFENGPIRPDLTQALRHFTTACQQGDQESCKQQSELQRRLELQKRQVADGR